ncbi:hypothetical protein [Flammeovirga pacifica]|uniref:Outer membrane protein beta-barrel domain-containing protein n=1 Tax=Flammeovirga pacifica TaxID=915059 RepID=A0A1S1YVE2_FLAPC|nr:hypothetical protein [Flammeovirga pacifica]OHX64970.1 hypothetical protein NH26_00705 [Flammeovirga pacifica]
MKIRLYIVFNLFFGFVYAEHCGDKLHLAKQAYQLGQLEKIDSLLYDCIASNAYNEEEGEEAIVLFCSALYFEGEHEKASKVLVKYLKKNPYFIPRNKVLEEFQYVLDRIPRDPIFYIQVGAGINGTLPVSTSNYTIGFHNDPPQMIMGGGYQGQLSVGVNLFPNLQWMVFSEWTNQRFSISELQLEGGNTFSKEEELNYLTLGSSLQINLKASNRKRINEGTSRINKPYLYLELGGSFKKLVNANAQISLSTFNEGVSKEVSDHLDTRSQRREYQLSGMIGIGFKKNIKKGCLMFKTTIDVPFQSFNLASKRYDSPQLLYTYGYVDQDIWLPSVALNVGYQFQFFRFKHGTSR